MITVGISTKDRPECLEKTLRILQDWAEPISEVLILDDGSASRIAASVLSVGNAEVRVIRNECSSGYIVARNRLADLARNRYYLSLDDDSYPVWGSLLNALEYLKGRSDMLALSFPIEDPSGGPSINILKQYTAHRVFQFIGCAHLLDLQSFKKLGGYWEWLTHQGEEKEISYRAFKNGLRVEHYPGLLVRHDYTTKQRNWQRMNYYGQRNEVVIAYLYYPLALFLGKVLRQGAVIARYRTTAERAGLWRGLIDGIATTRDWKRRRNRLSFDEFRVIRKLPVC